MICHKTNKRASYLARFGYIGSYFHGLQPNKGFATAGGALCDVLQVAAGVPPKALQFSARTDAGVHALENYATFWFPKPFDHERFASNLRRASLHNLLYVDVKPVRFDVHARANAKGKWYRYVIEDDADVSCHTSNPLAWQIVPSLDVNSMQIAANALIGTHAFDAFRHGGCTANSTVKTLTRLQITKTPTNQIHIDIEGSAFLRRMVRIIVGTLAEVGAGLRQPSDIQSILTSKRRDQTGPSAPASGLTLMRVDFDT